MLNREDKRNIILIIIGFVVLIVLAILCGAPVANGEELAEIAPAAVATDSHLFDITPYVTGIFSLILLFISSWLIPMIKSKTTKEQQEIIQAGANIVVYAAEQLFKGTGMGQEKLAYATDQLRKQLANRGMKLDASALRPYIEAAVKALNLKQGQGILEECTAVPGLANWLRSDDEGKDIQ